MKSFCIKAIRWMTGLSVCGILIGVFLPFLKWEDWFGKGDSMSFIEIINESEEIKYLIIMGIALAVTLFALFSFEASTNLSASIFLLIAAIVGKCTLDSFKEEVVGYYSYGKGIGARLMEPAYVALILAAVLALGVDIYSFYFEKKLKGKLRAVIVPAGTDKGKCPKCGKTITENSKFCGFCGFEIGQLKCPKCGAQRQGTAQFCQECGERLPVIAVKGYGEDSRSALERLLSGEGEKESSAKHWVCGKCGEENSKDSRHCRNCGGGR